MAPKKMPLRPAKKKRRTRPLRQRQTPRTRWYSDIGDLAKLPDVTHNGGLLQDGAVSCLHGDAGSCKTFVALAIGSSIGYGLPLMPGGPRCRQGLVIYIAFEDPGGFKARRLAWLRYHQFPTRNLAMDGVKIVNPYSETISDMPGLDFDLLDLDKVNRLISHAHELARQSKMPVRLVVVDVLRDAVCGVESSKNLLLAGRHAKLISAALGTHVMMLHHNTKRTEQMRGPAILEGMLQQRFLLTRLGSSITLSIKKNREGPTGVALDIKAHQIVMGLVKGKKPIDSLAMEFCGYTNNELEDYSETKLREIAEIMERDSHLSMMKLIKTMGMSADGRGGMQRRMIRNAVPVAPGALIYLGGSDYRRVWRETLRGRDIIYCQSVDPSEGKTEAAEETARKGQPRVEPEIARVLKRKKAA